MDLFVDTSVWFAAANKNDSYNSRAKAILEEADALLTTDHVLVECWLLVRRSIGRQAAHRFWEGMLQGVAAVQPVLPADVQKAWQIGQAFPDQDFSIVDLTSFVVMERLGLERVASFDQDFVIYRYGSDRRKAFEVLR
jgi:predicted nucleic acid-binding protein